MAQTFFPITPVRVTTPGVNYNWSDVDITAYVPVGAALAILYIENGGTGALRDWGIRGYGPPAAWYNSIPGLHCAWATVGIGWAGDAGGYERRFSFYNVSGTPNKVQAWLIGYAMGPGVVSNIGGYISAGIGDDAWTMVDLGPAGLNLIPVGTLGVIVAAYSTHGTDRDWGLRMNGSSDDRTLSLSGYMTQHSFVVGVDANLRVECYKDNAAVHHYLIGYITDGVVFYQNAVEVTPAGVNTWNPLVPSLPGAGVMGFIEVVGAAGQKYGAGDIGTVPSAFYLSSARHNSAFVPASNWNGQKENAGTQFFLTGYAERGAMVGGINPALVEILTGV